MPKPGREGRGQSQKRPREPPLTFGPLSEGSSYANSDDLNAGLISAARLGLDLNELEVGQYAGGEVARITRGKAFN